MKGAYDVRTGLQSDGTASILANSKTLTVDCADLKNITIQLVQVVDAGTVVLVTEKSLDGTYWETVDASTAEGDFAAGNGAAVSFSLSDSNGMALRCKQVRVRTTTYTSTGEYAMRVSGEMAA